MIGDFLNMLSGVVFSLLNKIFGILPEMPFDIDDLNAFAQNDIVLTCLAWLNYFLPVKEAAAIVALWSFAMLTYVGFRLAVKYSEGLR